MAPVYHTDPMQPKRAFPTRSKSNRSEKPQEGTSNSYEHPREKGEPKHGNQMLDLKDSVPSQTHALFFDCVSDNAIEHILQFLSAKPEYADWAIHVPRKTGEALMHSSGSLSRVSRKEFGLLFDELSDSTVEAIVRFLASESRHGLPHDL